MPVAPEMYYFAYDGGGGDRPPVVLIHGAGGTHLHWPSEVRRLPGYRTFAIDLPGHGKSGSCGMQSVASYSRALLDWVKAADMYRPVFVGHSLGSAIVQQLALFFPGQVLG